MCGVARVEDGKPVTEFSVLKFICKNTKLLFNKPICL